MSGVTAGHGGESEPQRKQHEEQCLKRFAHVYLAVCLKLLPGLARHVISVPGEPGR